MPGPKYKHTLPWTSEDSEAYTRYTKGLRGPRELEANAKSCWVTRNHSGKTRERKTTAR